PEDARIENRAAKQPQILQVEGAEVERNDRPGDGTGDRVAAATLEDVEKLRPPRTADDIDHDVDALPLERADQVRTARNDAMPSEGFDLGRFRGARDGDHTCAAPAGELHSRRADST